MLNKKGQALSMLTGLVAPLIALAIVFAVGFLIVREMADQIESQRSGNWCPDHAGSAYTYNASDNRCYNTTGVGADYEPAFGYGWNATVTTQEAMDDIPGWLGIVIVAIIGAIILGLVSLFRSR